MKKLISKTVLNISVICLLIWVFLPSVSGAEAQMSLFNIGVEKQISSPDMNLSFLGGDDDYAYPKLIIPNNGNPLIAFVDKKSEKFYMAEISDRDVRILYNQPSYDGNSWKRWPIIIEKRNKIYFVQFPLLSPEMINKIKVYLFDSENKKIKLEEDIVFSRDKRCQLSGIYPFQEKFMLIGQCNYICLRFLPTVLMGGNPTYYHNASFLLDGSQRPARQKIEEPGCYSVWKQVYDVSLSGTLQAAWVRNTTTLGVKHDEIIFLSTNKDGANWTTPIELYSVKNVELINGHISDHINDLSLASYGNSSYVLWQDREKGIFFSEINSGKKNELTSISYNRDVEGSSGYHPGASTIKIAADSDGNAYVLWVENFLKEYDLCFKARINGRWTEKLIINYGSTSAVLPDMKVDKEGNIHITYIKLINPHEAHNTLGDYKYGCFYMKLERQDKKD